MAHAYLIMAHDDAAHLAALVDRLCPPGSPNIAVAHIDRRSALWREADALRARCPALRIIARPEAVYWGHVSQLKAITHMLREALQAAPWRMAHLISGADWPVHPALDTGLCHIEAVPGLQPERMDRFHLDSRCRRPDPTRPLNWYGARALRALSHALPLRTSLPWGPWHKGSAWWSLPHEACAAVLAELERAFAMGRLRGVICSDEHAVQTIIAHHFPDALAPNRRFLRWPEGAESPAWLTAADWPAAQASNAWFARKLSRRVDPFFLALPG